MSSYDSSTRWNIFDPSVDRQYTQFQNHTGIKFFWYMYIFFLGGKKEKNKNVVDRVLLGSWAERLRRVLASRASNKKHSVPCSAAQHLNLNALRAVPFGLSQSRKQTKLQRISIPGYDFL